MQVVFLIHKLSWFEKERLFSCECEEGVFLFKIVRVLVKIGFVQVSQYDTIAHSQHWCLVNRLHMYC